MHYKNENIQSVLVVLSYSYWQRCVSITRTTQGWQTYIYIYIFGGLAQPPMHVEIGGKLLPCTRKWTDVHKPSLMSYDHRIYHPMPINRPKSPMVLRLRLPIKVYNEFSGSSVEVYASFYKFSFPSSWSSSICTPFFSFMNSCITSIKYSMGVLHLCPTFQFST